MRTNVIITAVENCEKQTSAIQKIRQLQENELQAILDTGTYVQCCDCSKWRSVPLDRAPACSILLFLLFSERFSFQNRPFILNVAFIGDLTQVN